MSRVGLLCLLASAAVASAALVTLQADETKTTEGQSKREPASAKPQTVEPAAEPKAPFKNETLRGRVVWEAEALKRLYGVESDADAAEASIALETSDGQLCPIVKDFRGRGFWLDPRLRGIEIELLARRYDKAPAVQVVRWYLVRQGRRYELDYWCDVCAIPMYELKTCDCCQGETRLRERPADEATP